MRINEDYLDTVSTDELTTSSRMEDGRPDSYDAVLFFPIVNYPGLPQVLKMIDRIITATPELKKADVLKLRIDTDGIQYVINILAGADTYMIITATTNAFHYLAYGLKGDVRNIRSMLRMIINISGKFPIDILSAISVFDTEHKTDKMTE